MEISGQVVEWHSPLDEANGEPNGGFYVFEHGDIPQGKLQFLGRNGKKFAVHWDGKRMAKCVFEPVVE